jgi:hypothetical protein
MPNVPTLAPSQKSSARLDWLVAKMQTQATTLQEWRIFISFAPIRESVAVGENGQRVALQHRPDCEPFHRPAFAQSTSARKPVFLRDLAGFACIKRKFRSYLDLAHFAHSRINMEVETCDI